MTDECATKLQQYIDSVHPSSSQEIVDKTSIALDVYATGDNMDTHRGDYQPPVPGDEDVILSHGPWDEDPHAPDDSDHKKITNNTWQPISTAPTDGTVILAKWKDDTDPRPQQVKCADAGWGLTWFTPAGFNAEDTNNWIECTPPSHWQPIN